MVVDVDISQETGVDPDYSNWFNKGVIETNKIQGNEVDSSVKQTW